MAILRLRLRQDTTSFKFYTLTANGSITCRTDDDTYSASLYNGTVTITNPPTSAFYVDIEGDFTKIQLQSVTSLFRAKLTGEHHITDMSSMFSGCSYLTTIYELNTTGVTNMSNMFANCSRLTTLSLFDTSSVTTMSYMFIYCKELPSVPLFNTEKVIYMYGMFHGCEALTSVPLFNTINVTDMSGMFHDCFLLESIPCFNTPNLTNMKDMFTVCKVLKEIPQLDTSKVTNVKSAFTYCYELTTIPLLDFSNVVISNVIRDGDIFYNCPKLTTVGGFKNLKYGLYLRDDAPLLTGRSIRNIMDNCAPVAASDRVSISLSSNVVGYKDVYYNDPEYQKFLANNWTISPAIDPTHLRTEPELYNYIVEVFCDGTEEVNRLKKYTTKVDKELNTIVTLDEFINEYIKTDSTLDLSDKEFERSEGFPLTITYNENLAKIFYITKEISNTPFKVVYTDSLEKYNALENPDMNTMYIIGEGNNEMIIFNNQLVSNKGIKLERL